MERHRIVYIDEQKSEGRKFQRHFKDFDVEVWLPEEDLDNFIEKILSMNFKAIIVDYLLDEYKEDLNYKIVYNGADLLDRIRDHKANFPCIVLTSYDNDAMQQISDVNYVYPKAQLNETQGKVSLQERVRIMIEHYENKLKKAENRFQELLTKQKNQILSENEANELLKLDTFLEESLDKESALTKEKKQEIAIGTISDLLNSTKNLLTQLEKEKK